MNFKTVLSMLQNTKPQGFKAIDAQAEHREVAQQVLTILRAAAPEVIGAFFPE